LAENKKYVELLWYQKYDRIDLGEKLPFADIITKNDKMNKEAVCEEV